MAEREHMPEILIVDDVPENIDVLGEVLKPYYKRKAALNGEKAIQIATSERPPDLILLDVMMPEMDGYEVCRRLKADERTRDVPVIFVTAKTEVEDETAGFDVGAVDYITKPIIPAIVLARVKAQLELKQARQTIEQQNKVMLQDLETARRVQLGLVPSDDPGVPGLDIALAYEPATQVGGDLLDVVTLRDGRVLFFVGDAMGHGVQAALVMTVGKSALRTSVRTETDPAAVLLHMNQDLAGLFDDRFVTAGCCLVDPGTGHTELALAGHSGPLWYRAATGDIAQPGAPSLPLGLLDAPEYETFRLDLEPGDVLLLSTDGIVEAMNSEEQVFGAQRMRDVLLAGAGCPAREILSALAAALADHRGSEEMHDDLTVLMVRYNPADPAA